MDGLLQRTNGVMGRPRPVGEQCDAENARHGWQNSGRCEMPLEPKTVHTSPTGVELSPSIKSLALCSLHLYLPIATQFVKL